MGTKLSKAEVELFKRIAQADAETCSLKRAIEEVAAKLAIKIAKIKT